MVITRTIDGKDVDITLTDRELMDAYQEQEHNWDKSYIAGLLEDEGIKAPDAVISRLANSFRGGWNDNQVICDEEYELAYSIIEECDIPTA